MDPAQSNVIFSLPIDKSSSRSIITGLFMILHASKDCEHHNIQSVLIGP